MKSRFYFVNMDLLESIFICNNKLTCFYAGGLFIWVGLPVVMISFVYGEPRRFTYLVFSLTLISLSWFFAQSLAFLMI